MTSALPAHMNQSDLEELNVIKVEIDDINPKTIIGVLNYKHN
jgi:hypothetical protein